jgi:hypothetical protein
MRSFVVRRVRVKGGADDWIRVGFAQKCACACLGRLAHARQKLPLRLTISSASNHASVVLRDAAPRA